MMHTNQVENKYKYSTGIPNEKEILLATVRIGALNRSSIMAANNIKPLLFFAVIFIFFGKYMRQDK